MLTPRTAVLGRGRRESSVCEEGVCMRCQRRAQDGTLDAFAGTPLEPGHGRPHAHLGGRRSPEEHLDEWFLGVHLLTSRSCFRQMKREASTDGAEVDVAAFLEDALQRHSIAPRRDLEIFLRALVRNLWDVDRLLHEMNSEDELRQVERDFLVLGVVRTVTHELLWSSRDAAWFGEMVGRLAERCELAREDGEWISSAVMGMKKQLLARQLEWEAKQARWARRRRWELGSEEDAASGAKRRRHESACGIG